MKKASFVPFVLALLLAGMVTASAQVPTVSAVYDIDTMEMTATCPNAPVGSVIDTLWVVAEGFNIWINAIEYTIELPNAFTWLSDIVGTGAISIGNSQTGIGIAYPLPANGYDPLLVQILVFVWMCDACGPAVENSTIVVSGYPSSGKVRAVRWPDLVTVDAIGLTSTVCSLSPVEQTTWGHIKAMFLD
jgi:hypothetical protein